MRVTRILRRSVFAVVAPVVLSGASFTLAGGGAQEKVRIFVFGGEDMASGFVDKEVRDSVADLKARSAGKAGLQLVAVRDQAHVLVEVLARHKDKGEAAYGIAGGKPIVTVGDDQCWIDARMLVGDYEKKFTGSGDSWGAAAKDLAKQIDAWVTTNRQQILSGANQPK